MSNLFRMDDPQFSRLADIISSQQQDEAVPSDDSVRNQLNRIERVAFAGSRKLFSFLRFIVDEALEGRGESLKEIVIGDALYGGIQEYDPRIDSTVRVEARRLRRKLEAYYSNAGAADSVIISLPLGGYAPHFSIRPTCRDDVKVPWSGDAAKAAYEKIAILPFIALSGDAREEEFADGVTDEMIYAAERLSSYRVASRAMIYRYRGSQFSLRDVATETNCDIVLHGTIRKACNERRVSVELIDRFGQTIWSERMDVSAESDLGAQERAAATIMDILPSSGALCAPPAQ